MSLNAKLGASTLTASCKTDPGGIGIPGLTKTYEAELTNRGTLAVLVSVCGYVSDDLDHEKDLSHAVEKWEANAGRWQFFWGIPRRAFCKPNGFTFELYIRWERLWPGEILSSNFVAIQAVDALQLADRLRFVIRPYPGREHMVVATLW